MLDSVVFFRDTYIVCDKKTHIIYSPYTGKIARVENFSQENLDLMNKLQKGGFFSSLPISVNIDREWAGFRSLTLLLTRSCNLKCVYCYAVNNRRGERMSKEIALGSVNWFMNQFSGNRTTITFHGGGEPTLEQNIIKVVYEFAEKIKDSKTIKYLITTNGTMGRRFMDWMMTRRFGISISMDGPPEIQDRNRPFINGKPSSKVVEGNVKYLIDNDYPFTIRLTYSSSNDIVEIMHYFGQVGVKNLHLEPLFPHGRSYKVIHFGQGSSNGINAPESSELAKRFLQALDVCREYGIRVYNSHLVNFTKGIGYFCGSASGRSMIVTHDGLITGCLEVVDSKDKEIDIFQSGWWDVKTGGFQIDRSRISIFQNRHADKLQKCSECFARYTCAGGCAVKAVRNSSNFFDHDVSYCIFTKRLVPSLIQRIARMSKI